MLANAMCGLRDPKLEVVSTERCLAVYGWVTRRRPAKGRRGNLVTEDTPQSVKRPRMCGMTFIGTHAYMGVVGFVKVK